MEPFTTSAIIAGIVGYLGSQLKKDNSIINFISEFSTEAVKWIKPLFIKPDDTLQKEVQKLKENPESETKQKAVATMLESELEDNPSAEKFLREIYEKISKKEDFAGAKNVMNITGNNNIALQDIQGSNIKINSDNQTLSGTGDIVGGNKTENNKTYNIDKIDNAKFD